MKASRYYCSSVTTAPTTSQQPLNNISTNPSTNFRQCVGLLQHLLRFVHLQRARNGSPGDDSRLGMERPSFDPGGASVESHASSSGVHRGGEGGKVRTMCSAFVHLKDEAGAEVAAEIARILGGRVVEPKQPTTAKLVPAASHPGLMNFKNAPPARPTSSASFANGAHHRRVASQQHRRVVALRQGRPGHHHALLLDSDHHSHQPHHFLCHHHLLLRHPAAWRPKVRPSAAKLLQQQQPKEAAAPTHQLKNKVEQPQPLLLPCEK